MDLAIPEVADVQIHCDLFPTSGSVHMLRSILFHIRPMRRAVMCAATLANSALHHLRRAVEVADPVLQVHLLALIRAILGRLFEYDCATATGFSLCFFVLHFPRRSYASVGGVVAVPTLAPLHTIMPCEYIPQRMELPPRTMGVLGGPPLFCHCFLVSGVFLFIILAPCALR